MSPLSTEHTGAHRRAAVSAVFLQTSSVPEQITSEPPIAPPQVHGYFEDRPVPSSGSHVAVTHLGVPPVLHFWFAVHVAPPHLHGIVVATAEPSCVEHVGALCVARQMLPGWQMSPFVLHVAPPHLHGIVVATAEPSCVEHVGALLCDSILRKASLLWPPSAGGGWPGGGGGGRTMPVAGGRRAVAPTTAPSELHVPGGGDGGGWTGCGGGGRTTPTPSGRRAPQAMTGSGGGCGAAGGATGTGGGGSTIWVSGSGRSCASPRFRRTAREGSGGAEWACTSSRASANAVRRSSAWPCRAAAGGIGAIGAGKQEKRLAAWR